MDVDRTVVVAMAEAARWAPSVHNSQPWRFRSRSDGLDVLVDHGRALPWLDPDGRLRTVSCGAAVAAAGCASTALGLGTRTALLPDGPRGEVVARLVCVAPRTPTPADLRVAAAVTRRRTHPVLHPSDSLDPDRLADLAATVEDEGVTVTVLDPAGCRVLVDLMLQASEEHRASPTLREETRGWLRLPSRSAGDVDGVLRGSLSVWPHPAGSPSRDAPPAPAEDWPATRAAVDDLTGSTVLLLSTATDSRRDQVVAGIALERLLLHATALDMVASFVDMATQLPVTRARLRVLLARRGHVQVALRVGRQLIDVRTPPRRRLVDLLDADATTAVVDVRDGSSAAGGLHLADAWGVEG